ncbi:MAG TPA: pyridoxal 5'-phosphate synthase glutaminase subunit PdxT [Gaiellales bacterium]|nr:pyridoxal 5'-phosphate synthase glutaminase subunit PdxT [Gaiellales bacterium]
MAGSVGVLALQGAFREHVAALADCGVEAVEVRRPEQIAQLDGLIIPGGESTAISRLLEAYGLAGPIVDLHRAGGAVLGTCAGMIVAASEAVDGRPDQIHLGLIDVVVRRNAFGRQVASFEAELALAGDPRPLPGVFIRAPWIERAGGGVELLASHAGHPVAAREGQVLVTAFHPELTRDRRVHETFLEMVDTGRREVAA